jgi:hypothetical protein
VESRNRVERDSGCKKEESVRKRKKRQVEKKWLEV